MEKDELWEELRFEIETMNRLNSSKRGGRNSSGKRKQRWKNSFYW